MKTDTQIEVPELSYRETQILKLTCDGLTSKEIGKILSLSSRTIEHYRTTLLRKTGTHNKAGLIVYALKNNLYMV